MGLNEDVVIFELDRSTDRSQRRLSLYLNYIALHMALKEDVVYNYLNYIDLQMGLNKDVVIFELDRSTDGSQRRHSLYLHYIVVIFELDIFTDGLNEDIVYI